MPSEQTFVRVGPYQSSPSTWRPRQFLSVDFVVNNIKCAVTIRSLQGSGELLIYLTPKYSRNAERAFYLISLRQQWGGDGKFILSRHLFDRASRSFCRCSPHGDAYRVREIEYHPNNV